MNTFVEAGVTIALAVIGLAVVATIFSPRAHTAQVLQAGATGLATNIAVAESPVTGANISPNLSYPSNNLGFGFGS